MCGDRFEDNEKAVAWQPDKEDYYGSAGSGEFGSDTLPYHKECMRLVRIHCPHLRQISDDQFVEGNYSSLIDNVKINTPWYFEASEKVIPNSENNPLEETPIYTKPSNAEILAAHYNGVNLYDYVHARDSDINHNELLEAHNKGIDLSDYAYAKNSNLNKNEILDAHDKGINVGDYAYARGPVVTHDDVLKAHDKDARYVASGIANHYEDYSGKYDLNDHEAYHFANDITNLALTKDDFSVEDVNKTLLNTKANMYKCAPGYNPYSEIDWKSSSREFY